MTTEQSELIEKLNCLEFETAQLNHAYQLWKSKVEQGTAPEWMVAAIRATYDALITFCLDTVPAPALDTSDAGEIEGYTLSGETAPPPESALPGDDNMTTLCLRRGQPLQAEDAESASFVHVPVLVDGSLALTPFRQQNRIVGMLALADVPLALSTRHLAELEAAECEVSYVMEDESRTAEPSPELLSMREADWAEPEMRFDISPASMGDAVSEQPVIQQLQLEERTGAELPAQHRLATLRLPNWVVACFTGKFFGAASMVILASVAVLMVAGGALGIYVASRAAHILPLKNSAAQASAGAVAIPAGETAQVNFAPDPIVAPQGSSFVLNAVLSRGSDIASVAAQIDYDANLLQFMGVSQGGFLVKGGRQVVLAQRNDPSAGVLKISAEESPGTPGISGDGPVFALSFQARKKGKATVSIVPGAHDSQGRRIEMAGSEVSVRVN